MAKWKESTLERKVVNDKSVEEEYPQCPFIYK